MQLLVLRRLSNGAFRVALVVFVILVIIFPINIIISLMFSCNAVSLVVGHIAKSIVQSFL